jgi:hypothetical protein
MMIASGSLIDFEPQRILLSRAARDGRERQQEADLDPPYLDALGTGRSCRLTGWRYSQRLIYYSREALRWIE